MSDSDTRRPSRAPSRFVSRQKRQEALRTQKPVRETPIKRFDRKDVMERDLERYRAEARARLLQKGFDIPAFLMPKPKALDEDEGETPQSSDTDFHDYRPPVMMGPKPAPMVNDKKIAETRPEPVRNPVRPKPNRHVHVQNKFSGAAALHGGMNGPVANNAAREAEQAAAIAQEKTAYDDYVESLNGGATLLDRVREKDNSGDLVGAEDIQGRVDDLKEKEVRQSRIDLPDNTASWAARDELDRKRMEILAKQEMARGKSRRSNRKPMTWDKFLPRVAAYMIAAVAVGYVLVLTVNEFSAIIGK